MTSGVVRTSPGPVARAAKAWARSSSREERLLDSVVSFDRIFSSSEGTWPDGEHKNEEKNAPGTVSQYNRTPVVKSDARC